jgi:hypothetical protein
VEDVGRDLVDAGDPNLPESIRNDLTLDAAGLQAYFRLWEDCANTTEDLPIQAPVAVRCVKYDMANCDLIFT